MDKEIANLFHIIAVRSEAANPRNEEDYVMPDGLLYCGKCHTPKQCRPFPDNQDCIVHCLCDCEIQRQKDAERRLHESDIDIARKKCFIGTDGKVRDEIANTFATDEYHDKPAGYAKRYADKLCECLKAEKAAWDAIATQKDMQFNAIEKEEVPWLLFLGKKGTGKSFLAACICNALIDAGFTARFTNFAQIANDLMSEENKSEVYSNLTRSDLIVLDDLGAEKDTEYMEQIKYNVIDCICSSGKPCIITTNMAISEFEEPKDNQTQRICSRIYKKSLLISCIGEDRRKSKARETRDLRKKWIIDD